MSTQQWIDEARATGLQIAVDGRRNLVHVLNDLVGGTQCGVLEIDGPDPDDDTRVCMHCRELPGRERHYIAVTGRCFARHPLHRKARCVHAKGHEGEHFDSFFMRAWS